LGQCVHVLRALCDRHHRPHITPGGQNAEHVPPPAEAAFDLQRALEIGLVPLVWSAF
jgi:hypothetical protein